MPASSPKARRSQCDNCGGPLAGGRCYTCRPIQEPRPRRSGDIAQAVTCDAQTCYECAYRRRTIAA